MTRRLIGILLIAAGVTAAVLVMYLLVISSGMPHGRTVNGLREWLLLGASVVIVASLLYVGSRLVRGAAND